jgi:RNA polymerase sigma-70 factor (ECF subfamily)
MVDVEQTSLIEALKRHDRAAWAAAVERHYRDVYGFVYHLTGGDRAVAEDLSQEAWLEAVGGIEHCDASRGSFRNWLLGIARKRVALHYRRRNAKAGTVPFGDGEWGVADWGDGCVLPEEAAEQLERRRWCGPRCSWCLTTAEGCC